jgi:predicted RNase H-like HicB family nuclease
MFHIEIEREVDGRFLASIPELPGVMAYGDTEEVAVRKVKAIASLEALEDGMISESRREETGLPYEEYRASRLKRTGEGG